ncbi:hypothetical protein BO99DRAFT_27052 [Aspergillus violaceofuscus CBS 115571]|uniref:Uncharacterized protein n=1 Tax=Aspergillus violaceofuscus (strain CBS 115571) TaxID=1450538 RepID=A0A2V5GT15_ASPV1|nr:hypothetical protein BO99DRAFT_27052 [Aspergillus violaceofuscus CBS 115571]
MGGTVGPSVNRQRLHRVKQHQLTTDTSISTSNNKNKHNNNSNNRSDTGAKRDHASINAARKQRMGTVSPTETEYPFPATKPSTKFATPLDPATTTCDAAVPCASANSGITSREPFPPRVDCILPRQQGSFRANGVVDQRGFALG